MNGAQKLALILVAIGVALITGYIVVDLLVPVGPHGMF